MSKKQKFADELKRIIEDDRYGYDQSHRWGPDYDCSSLIIHCLAAAGYDVQEGSGYTGTLLNIAKHIGCDIYEFDGNVWDMEDIGFVWNVERHVEGVFNANLWGGAHINEFGDITGGMQGDQTGNEISYCTPYHLGSYPNDWDYYAVLPDDSDDSDDDDEYVEIHTTEHDWVRIDGLIDGIRCPSKNVKVDSWPTVPAHGIASDGDDYGGYLGTPAGTIRIW